MPEKTRFEKLKETAESTDRIKKDVISCADFILKELPPNQWVVKGLIPEGMTILSSAPGQFKTYILIALSEQISKGELGFNHFELEKRNVLFINEEMGEKAMQDRLITLGANSKDLYFTNLSGIKLENMKAILEVCKEKDIKLVIFDSLTRIHNLSENDASDVKKIFEAMLMLLKENISIIMTHHHRKSPIIKPKNGSEEMRGSTDLLAQIDCHLSIDEISNDKTYMLIKQLKLRQAENLPDFRVNIERDRENNKVSFAYKGEFSKEDAINIKFEESKSVILEIVKENPGFDKAEFIRMLRGKIGERLVESILIDLEKKGVIYCKTQRPKTYYIKEEITSLF